MLFDMITGDNDIITVNSDMISIIEHKVFKDMDIDDTLLIIPSRRVRIDGQWIWIADVEQNRIVLERLGFK